MADPGSPASGRDGQSQAEIQIEVEDQLNSNEWRLIGELLNPYDYSSDTAKAVIHKILQGSLNHFLPNLTISGSQAMPGPVKRYRLKIRDIVDGEPVGSLVATDPGRAWLAGQQYLYQGTNLLGGRAYLFLSTRSLERRLHPKEKIHLQVLPISSGTPTVRIKSLFIDGTDQTNTVTLSPATALSPFAVNITLPAYNKTAHTIEIDITGLTGTAEKLTYKLISLPSPFFRQLFYANSLGGLDHIPLTGKCEELNTPTGEIFEAQSYPPPSGEAGGGNTRAFNQRATDSLILRTGFMSQAEKKSLRDLILRNEAYLLEGSSLRKIILQNTQWAVSTDDSYLHSLQLSARYAWDEIAYAR